MVDLKAMKTAPAEGAAGSSCFFSWTLEGNNIAHGIFRWREGVWLSGRRVIRLCFRNGSGAFIAVHGDFGCGYSHYGEPAIASQTFQVLGKGFCLRF